MKERQPKAAFFMVFIFTMVFFMSIHSYAQSTQLENVMLYKSITPEENATIEKTEIRALVHISKARSDIHHKALADARHNLTEASLLLETVRDNLSTTTAKNLIKITRTRLEYENSQKVLNEFSPIFASLDHISVYFPTDKAKLHVTRAKGYLEKNEKTKAEKELVQADKSLIEVNRELPLLKTQHYVTKAQDYLVANNPGKADESLQEAERQAMVFQTNANSPIFQARQNLWLAFRNYLTNSHADTGAQLAQARNLLNKEAAGNNTKGKAEAKKLSSELGELEKKLAGKGSVVESDLKAAWEKSEALADRSAAYLSASLSEEETAQGVENNLIEARLHVAYAETYQVTTSEPEKAIKELDIANSFLQKADKTSLMVSTNSKKIRNISNVLLNLMQTPTDNDSTVQDRYDEVKNELSNLTSIEKSSDQIREIQSDR